jgi:hypothetical protein
MFVHVPFILPTVQLLHVSVQAVSQQTMSDDAVLLHSAPLALGSPLHFCTLHTAPPQAIHSTAVKQSTHAPIGLHAPAGHTVPTGAFVGTTIPFAHEFITQPVLGGASALSGAVAGFPPEQTGLLQSPLVSAGVSESSATDFGAMFSQVNFWQSLGTSGGVSVRS